MPGEVSATHSDEGSKEEEQKDIKTSHSDVVIPEEVVELLEDLPEAQQKAVRAVLIGVSHQRMWRGPLPPPDVLKEYNDAFT